MHPPRARGSTFYTNSKYVGLTFSNIPEGWTKQDVHDALLRLQHVINVIVVEENFQMNDGRTHFHCFIEFDKRRYVSVDMIMQALDEPHMYPNMMTLDNHLRWIEYLLKWDTNPVFSGLRWPTLGDIRKEVNKSKNDGIRNQVYTYVLTHSVAEAAQIWPGFVGNERNKLEAFKSMMDREARAQFERANRLGLPEYNQEQLQKLNGANTYIYAWAHFVAINNFNKKTVKQNTFGKKSHLYICAPKDTGKTRLLTTLKKVFDVYDYHMTQNNWQDNFRLEDDYDLIAFEEFDPIRDFTLAFANAFMDGYCQLNRKSIGPVKRNGRTPCLFLSNKSVNEAWRGSDHAQLEAFKSRVTEITIPEGQSITVFSELWDQGFNDFANEEAPEEEEGAVNFVLENYFFTDSN